MAQTATYGSTAAAPPEGVYTDQVVRNVSLAAVLWGVVGMLVARDHRFAAGLAGTQLRHFFSELWTPAPLHTNAVIFAFGGCVLFATSYHVVQRTCQTSLFLPKLAMFTFVGWQVVILAAAISLPLGMTQGKEYAELEWPIDLLIARGLGQLCHRVLRHPGYPQGTAHLRRQFGSSALSSSPWPCCTSSTAPPFQSACGRATRPMPAFRTR